jgi:hypothetical protein
MFCNFVDLEWVSNAGWASKRKWLLGSTPDAL